MSTDATFVRQIMKAVESDLTCPVCLSVISHTQTVMDCMHRFCAECISRSLRLGQKECPACRTRCASRRNLREDSRFDALISALNFDAEEMEKQIKVQAQRYLRSAHHQAYTKNVAKAVDRQNLLRFRRAEEKKKLSKTRRFLPDIQVSLVCKSLKEEEDASKLGPEMKIRVKVSRSAPVFYLKRFLTLRYSIPYVDGVDLILQGNSEKLSSDVSLDSLVKRMEEVKQTEVDEIFLFYDLNSETEYIRAQPPLPQSMIRAPITFTFASEPSNSLLTAKRNRLSKTEHVSNEEDGEIVKKRKYIRKNSLAAEQTQHLHTGRQTNINLNDPPIGKLKGADITFENLSIDFKYGNVHPSPQQLSFSSNYQVKPPPTQSHQKSSSNPRASASDYTTFPNPYVSRVSGLIPNTRNTSYSSNSLLNTTSQESRPLPSLLTGKHLSSSNLDVPSLESMTSNLSDAGISTGIPSTPQKSLLSTSSHQISNQRSKVPIPRGLLSDIDSDSDGMMPQEEILESGVVQQQSLSGPSTRNETGLFSLLDSNSMQFSNRGIHPNFDTSHGPYSSMSFQTVETKKRADNYVARSSTLQQQDHYDHRIQSSTSIPSNFRNSGKLSYISNDNLSAVPYSMYQAPSNYRSFNSMVYSHPTSSGYSGGLEPSSPSVYQVPYQQQMLNLHPPQYQSRPTVSSQMHPTSYQSQNLSRNDQQIYQQPWSNTGYPQQALPSQLPYGYPYLQQTSNPRQSLGTSSNPQHGSSQLNTNRAHHQSTGVAQPTRGTSISYSTKSVQNPASSNQSR